MKMELTEDEKYYIDAVIRNDIRSGSYLPNEHKFRFELLSKINK